MKKALEIIFIAYLIPILIEKCLKSFGFVLEWMQPEIACCIWTLALLFFVISAMRKNPPMRKAQQALCLFLPLLTFFDFNFDLCQGSAMTSICTLVNVGVLIAMTFRFVRSKWLKIPAGIVYVAWTAILIITAFVQFIFGGISETTVVRAVTSPDGTQIAEIVDIDEGALGGSTIVEVRKNVDVDLKFVQIRGVPECVYNGDWGEFEDMTLEWIDEHTLCINDSEYALTEDSSIR